MKNGFCVLLAAASLTACHADTEPDTPWLLVEPTEALYHAGDTVSVDVRNVGNDGVGLSTCDWTIQRLDATRWTDLGVPPSAANCGDSRLLIEVGNSYVLHAIGTVPTTLSPGTYRYGIPDVRSRQDNAQLPPSSRISAPFLVQP